MEVSTANTRYQFVSFYCYRGLGFSTLYCYEEVKKNAWLLRAVIPLHLAGDYDEHNRQHAGEMIFSTNGDSVTVVFETRELLTIRSARVAK
jgi:hypothetical protein